MKNKTKLMFIFIIGLYIITSCIFYIKTDNKISEINRKLDNIDTVHHIVIDTLDWKIIGYESNEEQ